jgi:hypothetical protein
MQIIRLDQVQLLHTFFAKSVTYILKCHVTYLWLQYVASHVSIATTPLCYVTYQPVMLITKVKMYMFVTIVLNK